MTVDKAYVMLSKGFDQHITYVAMSRHSEDLEMYWSRDEFKDYGELQDVLSRERRKAIA